MTTEAVFLLFGVLLSAFVCDANDIKTFSFDVKPGGEVFHFQNEMDGVACIFTYQAQGGTNENWVMQLERRHTGVVCTVERPSGVSYLFFQSFKMEVTGGSVDKVEVYGNNNKPLEEGEYKVDKSAKTISDVPGKFNSQLGRVVMAAITHNDEL